MESTVDPSDAVVLQDDGNVADISNVDSEGEDREKRLNEVLENTFDGLYDSEISGVLESESDSNEEIHQTKSLPDPSILLAPEHKTSNEDSVYSVLATGFSNGDESHNVSGQKQSCEIQPENSVPDVNSDPSIRTGFVYASQSNSVSYHNNESAYKLSASHSTMPGNSISDTKLGPSTKDSSVHISCSNMVHFNGGEYGDPTSERTSVSMFRNVSNQNNSAYLHSVAAKSHEVVTEKPSDFAKIFEAYQDTVSERTVSDRSLPAPKVNFSPYSSTTEQSGMVSRSSFNRQESQLNISNEMLQVSRDNTASETFDEQSLIHSDVCSIYNKLKKMLSGYLDGNSGVRLDLASMVDKLYKEYAVRCKQLSKLKKKINTVNNEKDFSKRELILLQQYSNEVEGRSKELWEELEKKKASSVSQLNKYNEICDKLSDVERKLQLEKSAKQEALEKLEHAQETIRSLQSQIHDLTRSEKFVSDEAAHAQVVNELKARHHNEAQVLQTENGELRALINSRDEMIDQLKKLLSTMAEKYKEADQTKVLAINRLLADVKKGQDEVERLQVTAKESTALKERLEQMEIVKANMETTNQYLEEEVRNLKCELQALHASHELNPEAPNYSTVMQSELNQTLMCLDSQRNMSSSLIGKLKDAEIELQMWMERAKLFEDKLETANRKNLSLEENFMKVCPEGSIPVAEHKKKINELENRKAEVENQLKDVLCRLKEVSESEAKLNELIQELHAQNAALIKQQNKDKKAAFDMYMKAKDEDIEKLHELHAREITGLKREIKYYKDEMYELKQFQLGKNGEDVRKQWEEKLQNEYEEKLRLLKEKMEEEKKEFQVQLLKKNEDLQDAWRKEKQTEVATYVLDIKKKLDEEFDACLTKEKQNVVLECEKEKQKIILEYEEKLKNKKQSRISLAKKEKIIEEYEEKLKNQEAVFLEEIKKMKKRASHTQSGRKRSLEKQSVAFLAEKEEVIKEFEEKLKNERQKADEEIKREKEQVVKECEEKLRNEKATLLLQLTEAKKALILEYETKLKHEKEAIRNQAHGEKDLIIFELEARLDQAKEEHSKFIEVLTEDLEERWNEEQQKLKTHFESQVSEQKLKYERNCLALKNEAEMHEVTIANLNSEIKKLTDEKLALETQLNFCVDENKKAELKLNEAVTAETNLKKSFSETEKRLRERLEKYKESIERLKEEMKNMRELIKAKTDLVFKHELTNKELLLKLENFHCQEKQRKAGCHSSCQTEESMVSSLAVRHIKEKCLATLDQVTNYANLEVKSQITERIRHCIIAYRDMLNAQVAAGTNKEFSNILRDIENLIHSFSEVHPSFQNNSSAILQESLPIPSSKTCVLSAQEFEALLQNACETEVSQKNAVKSTQTSTSTKVKTVMALGIPDINESFLDETVNTSTTYQVPDTHINDLITHIHQFIREIQ